MIGLHETPVVVVLCEHLEERPGLDPLHSRFELRFTDAARLPDAIAGAQVLFLWDFFSSAVERVWDRCTDLQWIHVAAAGVDTLLFPGLVSSDVVVTNARGTFDGPIAEFVLASVLAHAKLLHESHDLQQRHQWRHRETRGVADARALVVGTGAIGREIARLLDAAGLHVRGAGRSPRDADSDFGKVVSSADLPGQVGWADYVVNATPLTDATRALFDTAVFAAMKPTGVTAATPKTIATSSTSDEERALWRPTCWPRSPHAASTVRPSMSSIPSRCRPTRRCGTLPGWSCLRT